MISSKVFKTLFALFVTVAVVAAACVGFILGYDYVREQNARLEKLQGNVLVVGESTPGSTMIVIPRGSDTKEIADILKEAGAITPCSLPCFRKSMVLMAPIWPGRIM